MAYLFSIKCNYLSLPCQLLLLVLLVFPCALCAAKQLPLAINPLAATEKTPTNSSSSSGSSSEQQLQQLRHESYDKSDDDTLHRERRQVSDWFIAPNTRWCGRGNLANGTYNHLGGASMADKCCRKHDHCRMYIPAMSNRYELFNYRPYTLSHCSCDRRFRTCLKMASDEDANTIGKLFFNVVQTQCFVLRAEHVCQERGTGADASKCFKEVVRQKAHLQKNKKF